MSTATLTNEEARRTYEEIRAAERRALETLDEAGYPQMPQLAARLRHGESLEDYHFFESLQEAADTVGPADALPVDAR